MIPVEVRTGISRETLAAWLDTALVEVDRELAKAKLLRRIHARETFERAFAPVEDRCRCGEPDARPPCSYCEGGGDEASIDRD